jgi:hypothetical protein
MHAVVVAAALASPTPLDLAVAASDLSADAGVPSLAERSARATIGRLIVMNRVGALDHDAPDLRWFAIDLGWESELGLARGLVRQVATCPTLEDGAWCPPRRWFAAEAESYRRCAESWRARAEEYRTRATWETDREEPLLAWAMHFDAQADGYSGEYCRLAGFTGQAWCQPRRVVLAAIRQHIGEDRWAKRDWPGWTAPGAVSD